MKLRLVLIAVSLVAACGKYPKARIKLEQGARVPAPSFRIDGPEAPVFITIERSPEPADSNEAHISWRLIRRRDTTVTAPVLVTYGVVPDGYRAMQAPDSLVPMTYRVFAKLTHASGARAFTVYADGSIR